MKLWVDDEREAPEGWTRVRTANGAICMLNSLVPGGVEEISLDHDLGDRDHDPERTGYTVLQHIEEKVVHDDSYVPPIIHIHTANAGARPRMEAAVASIRRLTVRKLKKALERAEEK